MLLGMVVQFIVTTIGWRYAHVDRTIEDDRLALLHAKTAVVYLAELELRADVHASFDVIASHFW